MNKSRGGLRHIICCILSVIVCIGVCVQTGATENIQKNKIKVVKVGYYEDNNGFQMGSKKGERMYGYAYEYYQEIAKITGWKYEYVYGSWGTMYEKLEKGEIDIMAGVSKTKERKALFSYPENPMGSESYYLFIPSESNAIRANDQASLKHKTIGVNAHSLMEIQFRQYIKKNKIDCKIKTYAGHFESEKALKSGKIDGYVITDNYVVDGVKPVFKIGSSNIYFALTKSRTDLLKEINEAQDEILGINPHYANNLSQKYFNKSIVRVGLNQKEQEWINKKDTLTVGYLNNLLPYTDNKNDENSTESLLNKLTIEFSRFLNKKIYEKGYNTKDELTEALHKGDVDVIFPVYNDLWQAEKDNFAITNSIVSDRVVALYRGNYSSNLLSEVGIPARDGILKSYMKQYYPNAKLCYYNDLSSCMKALKKGEIQSIAETSNLWQRYKSENEIPEEIRDTDLNPSLSLCMAVSYHNSIFCSILNRALQQMDSTIITDAINQNLYAIPQYSVREFWEHNMQMIMFGLMLIMLLFVVWFIYFRVRVGRQQKLLENSNRHLKEQVITTGAFGHIYFCSYLLNLKDHKYKKINDTCYFDDELHMVLEQSENIKEKISDKVEMNYVGIITEFLDLNTIDQRLEKKKTGSYITVEYRDKTLGWCRAYMIAVQFDQNEKLSQVIFAIQDIDAEKREKLKNIQQKERAEYSARHDNLTGALNRNGMDEILALREVVKNPIAIIFFDVDKFKDINDTYGHEKGDHVLAMLKETLENTFRNSDYIIRLGGDEFVVILVNCRNFSWNLIVNNILKIHHEMKEKVMIDLPISVSAGICVSETGYYPEMKQLADEALYRTKNHGRAGCVLIDQSHHFIKEWHDPDFLNNQNI